MNHREESYDVDGNDAGPFSMTGADPLGPASTALFGYSVRKTAKWHL
jgi:hypothetical protein